MSFRDELFIATDLLKECTAAADAASHTPSMVADVSVSCCIALLVMMCPTAAAAVWEE
jgi:hypothetical protein